MKSMKKAMLIAVAALVTLPFGAFAASAVGNGGATGPMHTMQVFKGRVKGGGATSNLTYQGGKVETTPAVYIDFWGSWWDGGTVTGTQNQNQYTPAAAMTYIQDFFGNVGGSGWANIDTQYCQGGTTGTTTCGTSSSHVTNAAAPTQLIKFMVDTSPVPTSPSQSSIATEAQAAATAMGDAPTSQPAATVFVFTPSGDSMSGFGTSWCAWHSVTSLGGQSLPYAYMPYQPDAGASCGENFVNPATSANSFGNGYFDGFSVVGGHEYAEAVTDPITANGSYAWLDSRGSEIGDKCAWNSASNNTSLGGILFAVQPLWSNAASGCKLSY